MAGIGDRVPMTNPLRATSAHIHLERVAPVELAIRRRDGGVAAVSRMSHRSVPSSK